MRILIAWCLGGNWGHVSRQLGLAEKLIALGATIDWAVPPVRATAMRPVRERGHRVFVSGAVASPCRPKREPTSFADILLSTGFGNAPELKRQVAAWLALYERLRPDAVLLDYAPAAQAAALLSGRPAWQISNGFDTPPPHCPAYERNVRGPYLEQRSAHQVDQIDTTLHRVASALGAGGKINLRCLIEYPMRWLDCIATTDPYAPRVAGERLHYLGPQGGAPKATAAHWPASVAIDERVFAYLRGRGRSQVQVLQALKARGMQVLCVWPDAEESVAAALVDERLRLTRMPVRIDEALNGAAAAVNYGSSTTVTQALLAGRVQLMIPSDTEKRWISDRVAAEGVGIAVQAHASTAEIKVAVDALLDDHEMQTRARDIASCHRSLPGASARVIAESLAALR